MSRYEHGRVLAVNEKQLGSELVAAHTAGAMSLTVEDPVDFDEDGGHLMIADQVIEYSTYDDDTGEITLLSALAADATNSESVWLYDTLDQTVTTELLAEVELDGDDDNADALECAVAHHLTGKLEEGIRGLRGESVLLEQDGDEWRIVDVLGRAKTAAPAFSLVRQTVSQAIPNAFAWTYLTWGTEVSGSGGMWNPATPDRLTFTTPGLYEIAAGLVHDGTSATFADNLIGIEVYSSAGVMRNVANDRGARRNGQDVTVTGVDVVAAGDYVRVAYYQSTGGVRNTIVDARTYLFARRVASSVTTPPATE